ncbi:MAG: ribonuclease J [Christensenellaceae bacterium]|jgi:ribonuclease J|nr:ribonuclease J [Christensenellaceae bacterium]
MFFGSSIRHVIAVRGCVLAKELKIIFLGGIGEIGKNMTLLEYNDSIIVIDAGLSFPNPEEMPGIDFLIPDFSYIVQRKDKIKGIVLTHGHEDHIGAVPYILKEVNTPVYGSNLTIALVQHKLNEHKMTGSKLIEAHDRESVSMGCFSVEFIRITHSIAGSFAVSITTPKGVIFFTGDFKIDHTPIDGKVIDFARIAEIGSRGVLLMLQDSTNAERDGYTMSERNVGKSLDTIFSQNTNKRILVATFASNIHRVQQIINCAVKYGRRIAFSGRSMENIAKIASHIKELIFPPDRLIDLDKISSIPYDRLCVITTGTQGEPESALSRMSMNEFKSIMINKNDTVILSANPIPGNEKPIYKLINNLSRLGADVVYESLHAVHVSGHACREELKMMISLVHPKYFIPVHGEYRHLKKHAELAEMMGIPSENITIPELGHVFLVSKSGINRSESVPSGSIMLDGNLQENSEMQLRDRKTISEDGIVIVLVTLSQTGVLTSAPIVITRGLNITDTVVEAIKESVSERFNSVETGEVDVNDVKNIVRKTTSKILFSHVKRRALIIPIVIEV